MHVLSSADGLSSVHGTITGTRARHAQGSLVSPKVRVGRLVKAELEKRDRRDGRLMAAPATGVSEQSMGGLLGQLNLL